MNDPSIPMDTRVARMPNSAPMIRYSQILASRAEPTRSAQLRQSVWMLTPSLGVRDYLRNELETSSHFVAGRSLSTTKDAVRHFRRMQPDILLVDVDMVWSDVISLFGTVKRKYPRVSLIAVSSENCERLFDALQAGASGFIVRTKTEGDCITCLTELIMGGAPLSRVAARMLVEKFHHNYTSPLTRRETEVLQMVHEGKTFTQVSTALHIARETIKTHVRNIYVKLGVNCRADAIKKAIKERYI